MHISRDRVGPEQTDRLPSKPASLLRQEVRLGRDGKWPVLKVYRVTSFSRLVCTAVDVLYSSCDGDLVSVKT